MNKHLSFSASLVVTLSIIIASLIPSLPVTAASTQDSVPIDHSESDVISPPPEGAKTAAGAGWYDGTIKYSQILNCISIIQGYPYYEQGAGTYVGYYADPSTLQPKPGQVYYIHLIIYGLGNACSGMYAYVDIGLPANTSLAISTTNPVYCFAGGVLSTGCPQVLPSSTYNTGFYNIPSTAGNKTWPLPQGGNWEFQIPVVSSTPLSGSTLTGAVWMLDGNSSPWLVPTQGIYVFTPPAPGAFNKSNPVNGGTNIPSVFTLSWGSSSNATSYEYCVDTVNDNTCNTNWVSVGTNTSATTSSVSFGQKYWQVRAVNSSSTTYANNGTWWTFTVGEKPGAFSKIAPANLSTGRPLTLTLKWGSSLNAVSYQYCVDTVNDNKCNTSWKSAGANTSISITGLLKGKTYYWQIRAKNAIGTRLANNGTWWRFSTKP